MDTPRAVKKNNGWTSNFLLKVDLELNPRELTAYERYCEYCKRVCGYPGGPDYMWYVETSKIPFRSL